MFSNYFIALIFLISILVLFYVFKYTNISKRISGFIRSIKIIFFSKSIDDNEFNEVLKINGYEYDPKQDIIYSSMDAWQREFGYCRLYDEAAAPLSMIMDCESIYFEYDGKRWLIEFWKGQYGLTVGGEIGVYNTKGPDLNIPGIFNGTFYDCASNEDLLFMSYALIKDNKILFTREDKHWWLTGFKLGEISEPSDLTMIVDITLKDQIMCDAFVNGLKNANYLDKELFIIRNTVSFVYNTPHVPQPYTRTKITDELTQSKNKELCNMYYELTKDYESTPDKIKVIREKSPEMYQEILHMGRNNNLFSIFNEIRDYLN